MDCASLTATTFTLGAGTPATPVAGKAICSGGSAAVSPAARLPSDALFTATITTGAQSAGGAALAASYVWTFTTGSVAGVGQPVSLGAAGDFVILAKSAISTVPTSAVTGNLGLSPAAATFITGFSPTADATDVFGTSPQVTGKIYAANSALPPPPNPPAAGASIDLVFTHPASRAPDVTELGA